MDSNEKLYAAPNADLLSDEELSQTSGGFLEMPLSSAYTAKTLPLVRGKDDVLFEEDDLVPDPQPGFPPLPVTLPAGKKKKKRAGFGSMRF